MFRERVLVKLKVGVGKTNVQLRAARVTFHRSLSRGEVDSGILRWIGLGFETDIVFACNKIVDDLSPTDCRRSHVNVNPNCAPEG